MNKVKAKKQDCFLKRTSFLKVNETKIVDRSLIKQLTFSFLIIKKNHSLLLPYGYSTFHIMDSQHDLRVAITGMGIPFSSKGFYIYF